MLLIVAIFCRTTLNIWRTLSRFCQLQNGIITTAAIADSGAGERVLEGHSIIMYYYLHPSVGDAALPNPEADGATVVVVIRARTANWRCALGNGRDNQRVSHCPVAGEKDQPDKHVNQPLPSAHRRSSRNNVCGASAARQGADTDIADSDTPASPLPDAHGPVPAGRHQMTLPE